MDFISPKLFIRLHYSRSELFQEAEKIKDEPKRYKVVCKINDKIKRAYLLLDSAKQERTQLYETPLDTYTMKRNEVYKEGSRLVSVVRFKPAFKIYSVEFSIYRDYIDNLYVSDKEYIEFCTYPILTIPYTI